MQKYIIDGNNLIGKIPELKSIPKKEQQMARERLALILDRYFAGKKLRISLHYDGFAGPAIKTDSISIHYSDARPADDFIRREIEHSKNPKLLTIVTSDNSLAAFARACSCRVIKAEEFAGELSRKEINDEAERIKSISKDEIKRLFNL